VAGLQTAAFLRAQNRDEGSVFAGRGITPGVKVELVIVLIASFAYFYLKNRRIGKTKNLAKSLFYTFALYALFFGYASILFPLKGLEAAGFGLELDDFVLSNLYLTTIFFAGIALAFLAKKSLVKAIAKEARPLRTLHFELMYETAKVNPWNFLP